MWTVLIIFRNMYTYRSMNVIAIEENGHELEREVGVRIGGKRQERDVIMLKYQK